MLPLMSGLTLPVGTGLTGALSELATMDYPSSFYVSIALSTGSALPYPNCNSLHQGETRELGLSILWNFSSLGERVRCITLADPNPKSKSKSKSKIQNPKTIVVAVTCYIQNQTPKSKSKSSAQLNQLSFTVIIGQIQIQIIMNLLFTSTTKPTKFYCYYRPNPNPILARN
jgi:hypothetical protein